VPGRPFIGSEGDRGGWTERGIRWPVVGRHYGPSGSVGKGNRGGELGVKRGGGVQHHSWERRGRWDGARARGGGSCVWLASFWERRKLGGAHAAVRGEGGGGLGRPEAKA
jgi:hypothetical protein